MNKKVINASNNNQPELSVVLITPNNYKTIEKTIEYLYNQNVRNTIEIVIVVPKLDVLNPDIATLSTFHSYKYLELGEFYDTGHALAEGYLNCSAEIVAYCEEHSFPEPLWAETIIKRHEEPWAAVGWSVANYNPDNMVSWASFYMDFGRCVQPVNSEEKYSLASHHISYKKESLLKFKENLDELLENEAVIINEFKKHGYRAYLESRIHSNHICIAKFSSFLISEYHSGRLFAVNKSKHDNWSLIRKLVYIAGSPLRPVVKLYRISKDLYRTEKINLLVPGILPVLTSALIFYSAGEVIGYMFGVGQSAASRMGIELSRSDHI